MSLRENYHSVNEHAQLITEDTSQEDSPTETRRRAVDYDTALEATGRGRFFYILLILCGWANASEAIEVLALAFLLPSAECDLKLTSHDKGLINVMLFLGMLFGGYIWGCVGDFVGRRKTLVLSLFVNAAFAALSAFVSSLPWFLVFRFISGLGVGGSVPLIWTYFAEFQPKSERGSNLSIVASFWMIGNVIVAGLALAIIPEWYISIFGSVSSWRVFTVVCSIPSLISMFTLLWLPESPKFLLSQGRNGEALDVFRRVYRINHRESAQPYPVERLRRDDVKINRRTPLSGFIENCCLLFERPLLKYTLILIFINFSLQFGYYGLWMWLPELFERLQEYQEMFPGKHATVCQMSSIHNIVSNSTDSWAHCDKPMDTWVFKQSMIIAACNAPANIWSILHMDKLGRKFFLVLGLLGSGATVFSIYVVTSALHSLILACVFGSVANLAFNSLNCLGTELFPTSLRCTGMAVTLVAARLGAIAGNEVFGIFIDLACSVPILLVASLFSGAGLLGLLLPNTSNQALT